MRPSALTFLLIALGPWAPALGQDKLDWDSAYIYGMHDWESAEFMCRNVGVGPTNCGVPGNCNFDTLDCDHGWVVALFESQNGSGTNMDWLYDVHGVKFLVRLDHTFSKSVADDFNAEVNGVVGFIRNSSSRIRNWIVGNETNIWDPVTADHYGRCFAEIRRQVKATDRAGDRIILQAVAPWAPEWDNYLRTILDTVRAEGQRPDGVAIHAYTHGDGHNDGALISSDEQRNGWYWHFRVFETAIAIVEEYGFGDAALFITEAGDYCETGACWRDENLGWFQAMYDYTNDWNEGNPDRKIRAVAPYRWTAAGDGHDHDFRIDNRYSLQEDYIMAASQGYRWDTSVEPPGCQNDQDCDPGLACDPVSGECIEAPQGPPRLSDLADLVLTAGESRLAYLDLYAEVSDPDTPLEELTMEMTVSDDGCGVALREGRFVDVLPEAGWTGVCTARVTVSDGLGQDEDAFTVTVVPGGECDAFTEAFEDGVLPGWDVWRAPWCVGANNPALVAGNESGGALGLAATYCEFGTARAVTGLVVGHRYRLTVDIRKTAADGTGAPATPDLNWVEFGWGLDQAGATWSTAPKEDGLAGVWQAYSLEFQAPDQEIVLYTKVGGTEPLGIAVSFDNFCLDDLDALIPPLPDAGPSLPDVFFQTDIAQAQADLPPGTAQTDIPPAQADLFPPPFLDVPPPKRDIAPYVEPDVGEISPWVWADISAPDVPAQAAGATIQASGCSCALVP